ncbi:MAG: formylglycine-generating enzyme family protein [Verrucomicrobiota bacterium]
MELLSVSPGQYERGFPGDGADHQFKLQHLYSLSQDLRKETPSHRVEITKGFSIAQTEVTVGQFRQFTLATEYVTTAEKAGGALGFFPQEKNYVDRFHLDPEVTWKAPGFEQSDSHPGVCVSWADAQEFCSWLSQKEGRKYRLPTEAEWEYACRAGTMTWYSWGEDPDDAYAHGNVADGALEDAFPNTTRYQRAVKLGEDQGDGVVLTAKVASFQPNPWKLYDMHGNVWEWCQDRWKADLYNDYFKDVPRTERSSVVIMDPLFETATAQHEYGDWRVLRGGAWTCAPAAVRSSIRTFAEAGDASVYTGFRVVRE